MISLARLWKLSVLLASTLIAVPLGAQISTTGTLRPNPESAPAQPMGDKPAEVRRAAPEPAPRIVEPKEPATPPEIAQSQDLPTVQDGGRLDLMCFGGGSANKASVATAWGYSNFGRWNGTSTATVVGQRSQGFDDQVNLYLQNDEGRVRMPRTMLPVIRGGEDGWFKLKDIYVASNEITASVAVSLFNNPKLRLDRYSGTISISGKSGDFTGQCQRFDPQEMERAF